MAKRKSSRKNPSSTTNGSGETGNGAGGYATASAPDNPNAASSETLTATANQTEKQTDAVMTETIAAGEDLLERLQAALSGLDGKLAAAESTLESLTEGIDFPEVLGETLDGLQTTVTQLKQQLPEAVRYNTESIVALHAQVAELEAALAQAPVEGTGDGIDEVAIAELRTRIQTIDRQLADADDAELKAAIADCQQRIETQLQEREGRDAQVQSQLAELADRVAEPIDLPPELVELPQSLDALQATVRQLEERGDSAARGTEDIEASIRSIQSATTSLEEQFSEAIANRSEGDWQTATSELATQLEALKVQLPEAVSFNTQSIVSLNEQLTDLQEVLKQVTEAESDTEPDAAWQSAITELSAKLEGLQQELPDSVSGNTQSIASLTEQLGAVQDALSDVTAAATDADKHSDLQAEVSNLRTKLEELQQQLPEAVSGNTQSIASLTQQLAAVQDALKDVTAAEPDTDAEATWQAAITELSANVEDLQQKLPEAVSVNAQSIVSLTEQLVTVQDALKVVTAAEADSDKDSEVRAEIATLSTKLEDLQQQLPETVSGNSQSIASLTEQLGAVQAALSDVTAAATDSDKHSGLQAEVSNLRTKLEELQQQLPEVVSGNTQSIASLTEQLGVVQAALKDATAAEPDTEAEAAWQAAISELSATVEDLQQNLPEAVSINAQSIASLTEQYGAVQEALNEVTAAATDSDKDSELQSEMVTLSTKLEELQQQLPEAVSYNTQSIVSLNEQLTEIQTALKQISDANQEDDSAETIAQLQQSMSQVEEQLQQALSTAELVDELRSAQQALEQQIQSNAEQLDQRPSAAQFTELQNQLESGRRVGSLEAIIQRAEALEQKPSQPPTWEVDIEEVRSSIELLSRRIPEAYQLNSELTARIDEQLSELQAQVTQLADRPLPILTPDALAELEAQVTQLTDRPLPTLTPDALVELEAQVTQLADRPLPTLTPDALVELEAAIEALQASQTKMQTQLETAAQDAERSDNSSTDEIQVTVTGLAERLETLSQQLPEAVSYNTQSIVSLQEQLVGLEGRATAQTADSEGKAAETTKLVTSHDAGHEHADDEDAKETERKPVHFAPDADAGERLEMLEISYDDIDKRMDAVDIKVVSRASQEQVNELQAELATRAASGDVEQVRAQLDQLQTELAGRAASQDVDQVRSQLDQLQTDLETRAGSDEVERVGGQLDRLQVELDGRAASQDVEEIRRHLDSVQAELKTRAASQDLEDLLGQLSELDDAIRHPAPLWQEDINDIRDRLDAVVAQLPEVIQFNTDTSVQLEARVSALQQQLADLQVDTLQAQLDRLQERLEAGDGSTGNDSSDATEDFRAADESLQALREDVAQLAERLDRLPVDVDTSATQQPWAEDLQAIAAQLDEQVVTIAALQDRLDSNLDVETPIPISEEQSEDEVPPQALVQLRTDVDALQPIAEKSTELEHQLSTFATTLYALQSIVTPLEQQLPEALRYNTQSVVELHEQMALLKAQVEEAVSSNDTSDDSTSELEDLQLRCRQLQDQLGVLNALVDELESSNLDAEVQAVNARFGALSERLDVIGSWVEERESLDVAGMLAALKDEQNQLQDQWNQNRAEFPHLQQSLSTLENRFAQRSDANANDFASVQTELSRLLERQEQWEREIAEFPQLQQSLSALENRVTDRSDAHANDVASVQAELSRLLERQEQWGRDREELSQLQQSLSVLENRLAEKSDSSDISSMQAELSNLLAIHERQAQQSQQEELREEVALMTTQLIQLEQRLPEAIRLNTQSIVALQESLQGVESGLEGNRDGERIEELRSELDGLLAQQQSLKVWLISTVGVAFVALAAAVGQVLGWQVGM